MGFNTALSGLNAAANMLSVTGNNIANANTSGFKHSRSEFADVYASSMGGIGQTTPGSGVAIANVAQQFSQGNLQSTGNSLDLAISGDGFFVLGESASNIAKRSYTRAGMFHADENGTVVSNTGQPLLVYSPNGTTVAEGFSTGVYQALTLDTTQGEPKASSLITTAVNLDARKPAIDSTAYPFVGPVNGVVDPNSYTHSSSATVYDSLGNTHISTQYYVKTATTNQWDVYTYVDGVDAGGTTPPAAPAPTILTFDTNGKLTTPATGNIVYPPLTIAANASPLNLTLDLSGSTQVGSAFSVNALQQDGLPIGQLTSLDINDAGIVFARFSNGSSKPLGQVALARFQNSQGLAKLGDTKWGETTSSGQAVSGVAGAGTFGNIKAGSIEGSNVDLSAQLVNLIIAQQTYQANAQTITTENQIVQTLLNIR